MKGFERRSLYTLVSLLAVLSWKNEVQAWMTAPSPKDSPTAPSWIPSSVASFFGASPAASKQAAVQWKYYSYKNWTLAYRYKMASAGHEQDPPLFLIHPVGIGLSSWFWNKLLSEWPGTAVAPDLLGCGLSDPWVTLESSDLESFPLGWVEGCEVLWKKQPLRNKPCIVIAQGGLAPVGILLASRNPKKVSHLVLTSPPTWKDLTTSPVPSKELQFNYDFLRNPLWGKWAFDRLETRSAIAFFSDLFLFQNKSDATWLDLAQAECGHERRPPIMAFNAGYCQSRSYEAELCQLVKQPTIILQGQADPRLRKEYVENMKNCRVSTLVGKNVLPWESVQPVCEQLKTLI